MRIICNSLIKLMALCFTNSYIHTSLALIFMVASPPMQNGTFSALNIALQPEYICYILHSK